MSLSRASPAVQKPRVSETDFEDLLCNQGFSSKADRKGPRTIAEMRRQDQARDMDPLKLKVPSGQGSPATYPLPEVSGKTQWSRRHGLCGPAGPGGR